MEKLPIKIDYQNLPRYPDFKVAIYQDMVSGSPRDNDNLGILVCLWGHESIGCEKELPYTSQWQLERYFTKNNCVFLPVYVGFNKRLYTEKEFMTEHAGYIYTTDEKMSRFLVNRQQAEEDLRQEIQMLDAWRNGDVYGYVLEKDGVDIKLLDSSCWNYYNVHQCVGEALEAYVSYVESWQDPEYASDLLSENLHFFEIIPEQEKTPELAEQYLKAGGNLDYVPENVRSAMGLSLTFQDGTSLTL